MRPFWVTLIILATMVACVSFLVVSCSASRAKGAELQPVASKPLGIRNGDVLMFARRSVYVHVARPRRPPVVVIIR